MSTQKLHYENISGIRIRREGLLTWRCPLCKAEGQSPEVMRTCPECGSKEANLPGAQPTPSVPDGWLRAIDEALVTAHIGVANAHDTYEQAREKLNNLIGWHTDVATDPAVNGGYRLVPIEPTEEMLKAGQAEWLDCAGADPSWDVYQSMIAAAPNERSESPEENHEIQKEARSYRSNAVVQEGRSPYGVHKR